MSVERRSGIVTAESPATPAEADREPARGSGKAVFSKVSWGRYTGLALCIAFVAFFSLRLPDTFPTHTTAASIAGDQAVTLILALGLLVTLAVGQFDLSAAQNLGMSAVICSALLVNHHLNPVLAVLVTVVIGLLVGVVNAVFVSVIGVDSLVATLGMSSVLLAVTEQVSNFQFIGPAPAGFQNLANHDLFGFPIIAAYAVVLCLLVWYVLEHTPIGRRAYAVGANADAARLAGVRTVRYVVGSFVVAALFASLGGVLVAAKIGNVSPSLGPAYLLPSFAACFLGMTQLKPGRFNVWGTVLALLLLAIGVKGLQLMGNKLWVTDLFNGLALLVAVSAAVLSAKRTGRWRRRARRADAARGPKSSVATERS
ncbi:ABC transporter permease [Kribbella solani]|uniref:Ribose transport system permease protein n=1 Tax=Kribbella solani TaxID=236067 RepID=A0A841DN12_9ACTN|nr:ABC transporter permease [Kribbella solani]MBB5979922.1 ribose transport system permease protein [Kribbella solani]